MKKIVTVILLIQTLLLPAQNKNIKLPKVYGFEINYNDKVTNPIFKISINKKRDVYFEGEVLPHERLKDTVSKYLFKSPSKIYKTKAHIYAPKKILYKQIEYLKNQITKGSLYKIVYITEDKGKKLKGIPFRLHQTLLPKEIPSIENNKDKIIVEIPLSFDVGEEIITNLYDLNFSRAKQLLKDRNYVYVKIYHKNKVIINGQKVSLNNEEQINTLLKGRDFIFLEPNKKISYNTYLKNLSIFYKNFKNDKVMFPFIEITTELQEILNSKNIKL